MRSTQGRHQRRAAAQAPPPRLQAGRERASIDWQPGLWECASIDARQLAISRAGPAQLVQVCAPCCGGGMGAEAAPATAVLPASSCSAAAAAQRVRQDRSHRLTVSLRAQRRWPSSATPNAELAAHLKVQHHTQQVGVVHGGVSEARWPPASRRTPDDRGGTERQALGAVS